MTTPYNLRNAMAKSSNVDRSSRADPGSGNIIIVSQVDRGVCEMTGAGTRTLESAAGIGLGTTILCLSQTAAIIVAGATSETIGDGEFVKFEVVNDSSGDHEWRIIAGTRLNAEIAASTAADIVQDADIDALEGLAYGLRTVKLDVGNARVHDAMRTRLPATAATDDLGITYQAIGATAGDTAGRPTLTALVDAATLTQEGVIPWVVPDNYVAAGAISLSVDWTRADAATTSATLDVTAFRADDPGTDINTQAAVDINAAASGTQLFVLTATNIVPGEILFINLIAAINDGTTSLFHFEPEMIYTVADQS